MKVASLTVLYLTLSSQTVGSNYTPNVTSSQLIFRVISPGYAR